MGREKRLGSAERDSKLLSPEKVLSLRRNSAAANGESGQPLSSLFNQSLNESLNGLDRSLSKGSRDFGHESRRFVSENVHEEQRSSTNRLLGSSFREVANYSASNNSATVKSDFSETKRSVIDSASNVKGIRITLSLNHSGFDGRSFSASFGRPRSNSLSARFLGRLGQNGLLAFADRKQKFR